MWMRTIMNYQYRYGWILNFMAVVYPLRCTPLQPLHLWKRIWPWQSHQPTWVCNLKICKLIKLSSEVQWFNVSGQHQQFNTSFLIMFLYFLHPWAPGGTFMEVTKKLWAEGGVPRFYRGLAPGLIQVRQWLCSQEPLPTLSCHGCHVFFFEIPPVRSLPLTMPCRVWFLIFGYPWIPHSPRPSSCHHPVLQAPVSRFGDTAANDGALAALEHTSLPTAVGDLSCRKQWMVLTCFNPDPWDDL